MSAALTLAEPDDLDRLLAMAAKYHSEMGRPFDDAHRRAALLPLLEGASHGAVWLIGPKMGPVGYVAVGFVWSLECAGLLGMIEEIFIRENVRGRGIGTEALAALVARLSETGIAGIDLTVAKENDAAWRIFSRLGFEVRSGSNAMAWRPEAPA
ncbi:MAG: GNAT family N-acetyltransferase [Pseudomonadota bacterium]